MANAIFELTNHDETDDYDFVDSNSKVRYISKSFNDQTSRDEEDVEITFRTITKGADDAEVRLAIAEVEVLLDKAIRWMDNRTEDESIWLKAATKGTEKPRRTLIKDWWRVDVNTGPADSLLDESTTVISEWHLVRHHSWEALPANQFTAPTFTDCNSGGSYAGGTPNAGYEQNDGSTHLAHGTKPGRIRLVDIGDLGNDIDRIWIGFKTVKAIDTYFSPHEDFDNTWASPQVLGSGTSYLADANALNGVCLEIAGSSTYENKICVELPYYNNSNETRRGNYLILFRMRTTAADTEFRVSMFQSWDLISKIGAVSDTFGDVFVDDQYFHFYEMGVIQVPPEGYRAARRLQYADLYMQQIGLACERLSGSGNLRVDYYTWIPQEHAISIKNIKFGATAGSRNAQIVQTEDDELMGWTYQVTPGEVFIHELSPSNWVWPVDSSRDWIAVCAADSKIGGTSHGPLTVSVAPTMKVIPRYHTFNAD